MTLFVKLENGSFVPWIELRERLVNLDETAVKEYLRGASFTCLREGEKAFHLSEKEYSKLIGLSHSTRSGIQSARQEIKEISRELNWLLNCFYSVLGISVFVYFVASYYLEGRVERVACSVSVGFLLFIVEVLLYIIRN